MSSNAEHSVPHRVGAGISVPTMADWTRISTATQRLSIAACVAEFHQETTDVYVTPSAVAIGSKLMRRYCELKRHPQLVLLPRHSFACRRVLLHAEGNVQLMPQVILRHRTLGRIELHDVGLKAVVLGHMGQNINDRANLSLACFETQHANLIAQFQSRHITSSRARRMAE